jgi:uncharacterized membrane protein (DUF106 family)
MTELDISILNLKLVHKKRIEDLKNKIKELEQQIEIIQKSQEKIYDL